MHPTHVPMPLKVIGAYFIVAGFLSGLNALEAWNLSGAVAWILLLYVALDACAATGIFLLEGWVAPALILNGAGVAVFSALMFFTGAFTYATAWTLILSGGIGIMAYLNRRALRAGTPTLGAIFLLLWTISYAHLITPAIMSRI